MAVYDAWGGSWLTSWLTSWFPEEAVAVDNPLRHLTITLENRTVKYILDNRTTVINLEDRVLKVKI